MILVELPGALRPYAGGKVSIALEERCATVADVLAAVGSQAPGVLDRVTDEQGQVRPHVNVFVNEASIRFLDGLSTSTPDGTRILIVAAVSGG